MFIFLYSETVGWKGKGNIWFVTVQVWEQKFNPQEVHTLGHFYWNLMGPNSMLICVHTIFLVLWLQNESYLLYSLLFFFCFFFQDLSSGVFRLTSVNSSVELQAYKQVMLASLSEVASHSEVFYCTSQFGNM